MDGEVHHLTRIGVIAVNQAFVRIGDGKADRGGNVGLGNAVTALRKFQPGIPVVQADVRAVQQGGGHLSGLGNHVIVMAGRAAEQEVYRDASVAGDDGGRIADEGGGLGVPEGVFHGPLFHGRADLVHPVIGSLVVLVDRGRQGFLDQRGQGAFVLSDDYHVDAHRSGAVVPVGNSV